MKPAVALAAVLLLAACGEKVEDEKTTVAPPPAAPAAPAPVDAAVAPLTPEGWGPIRMEMTHDAAVAALGGKIIPDDMVHDEDWLACHMIRPQAPQGVWIMVEEDRVTRVSSEDGPLASDKGIVVGDTEAKVRAAYPSGLVETPHKYQDAPAKYLTWYKTPGAAGIRYSIDGEGKVHSMAGGTPSIEYVEGCA